MPALRALVIFLNQHNFSRLQPSLKYHHLMNQIRGAKQNTKKKRHDGQPAWPNAHPTIPWQHSLSDVATARGCHVNLRLP
mmetsp:Transcript_12122/g.26452  ORF Transcript_12122/g.26452 Transcript_12122/m.26452 type:complete len:80 (+) Transcript_12122:1217-1456(+)